MSDEDDDSLYESAPEDEGGAAAAGGGEQPKDTQMSGSCQNGMEESGLKLRVRRVGSNEDLEITANHGRETTVREIKEILRERTSVEQEQQKLIFCGRIMNDEHRLREYSHLGDGSTIHLLVRQQSQQSNGNHHQSHSEEEQERGGNHQVYQEGPAMTMVVDAEEASIPQIIGRIQTALQQAFQPPNQQGGNQPATTGTPHNDPAPLNPHVRVAYGSEGSNGSTESTANETSASTHSDATNSEGNNTQRNNGPAAMHRLETAAHSLRQLMNRSLPNVEVHAGSSATGERRVSSLLRSLHRVLHGAELPILSAAEAIHGIRESNDQALRQRLQGVFDSLSEQLQFLGMLMIQGGESLRRVHIARNHARNPSQGQEMYNRLQQYVRGSSSDNPFQALLHQRYHAQTGNTQAPSRPSTSQQSTSVSLGPFRFPFAEIASRIRAANSQHQSGRESSGGGNRNSSETRSSASPPEDDLD
eukprot:gb/GECG01002051.1/.p1 GENE.gb/GECG01002051.1/~~gb/GECG01002051.1/.p1  ORF type:complete len:474 (+),score=76.36 gb/GECG01002051.1/:1-1422(+)